MVLEVVNSNTQAAPSKGAAKIARAALSVINQKPQTKATSSTTKTTSSTTKAKSAAQPGDVSPRTLGKRRRKLVEAAVPPYISASTSAATQAPAAVVPVENKDGDTTTAKSALNPRVAAYEAIPPLVQASGAPPPWRCNWCSNENYATRPHCNMRKCGKPKGSIAPPSHKRGARLPVSPTGRLQCDTSAVLTDVCFLP